MHAGWSLGAAAGAGLGAAVITVGGPAALHLGLNGAVCVAVLLGVLPRPGWVRADAAAIAALVTILVWQAAEVLVFARTRRGIYAD